MNTEQQINKFMQTVREWGQKGYVKKIALCQMLAPGWIDTYGSLDATDANGRTFKDDVLDMYARVCK